MFGLTGKGRRALFAALLASTAAVAIQSHAHAQEASSSRQASVRFDIAAQPLASALSDFARQSGLQVLYPYEELQQLQAPALHGVYRPDDALDVLLANSGYRATVSGGTVRLEPISSPQHASAEESAGGTPADEDIVVTGTRIRGAAPAGANVIGIDREAIEQSGRTTVQDVLQTLPQVFPGSQGELTQLNSTSGGGNFALGSSVDLRGLGADATLTLLNGRRLAPAGLGTFVDISAIPLAAIERVEVLADGASATYGADAVGGVVNILLRRDLDHAETMVRFSMAESTSEQGLSHAFGQSWQGGSLIAGYEYRHRDPLAAADRDFAASTDLRQFGGANFSRTPASPGNIIQVGATPVVFAIPSGQNGLTLTQADLLTTFNFQNGNEGAFLIPDQESHALFASVRHDFTDDISLFLDVLGSRRSAYAERAQLGGAVPVPETNYYRQQNGLFAGQGPIFVSYFFGDDLGPQRSNSTSDTIVAALGAEFRLPSDWQLEASISLGDHVDAIDVSNIADSTAIRAALASADIAVAFNPFGDGNDNSAAVLAPLTFRQIIENDSELLTYALRADGGWFDLPGGRARAAIGFERRRETFSIDWLEVHAINTINVFTQLPGDRTTDAVYAEVFLPIFDTASLSLSVRREDSSDFGEATTPKIGAQWSVLPDLNLRATWGTSFRAPQFRQLLGGSAISVLTLPPSLDPGATNGSTGVLAITGANPNLRPEEAETWTAGFDFRPAWLSGFQFSATYFDVDFTNRIGTPGFILDAFLHPEQYEGYFVRNPTAQQIADAFAVTPNVFGIVPPDGIEVIFDERLSNLASLRVRGIDLAASYTFPTDLGQVSVFASASGLLQFERRNNATLPGTDLLDTILNPIDWRARAGVSLDADQWLFAASLTYADEYRDNLRTPNRDIDSWTTYDARITRRLGATNSNAGAELTLDVRNLTDADPPFANNPIGMGFDTLNASPLGRVIMIELRQRW